MRILLADGSPVNTPASPLYTPPTEKYFPRDNDFTDYAAPTLTGAEVKFYDAVVRLAERATGYCAYDTRQVALRAGIGYSTARAAVLVLEAGGFLLKCPQRKYLGTDAQGQEHWKGGENHFQLLGKANWLIFPRAPRKPRGKPRPPASPDDLAPRRLAEIKHQAAKSQQARAENKRSKQNWSFKTPPQDNNTRRFKKALAQAATPDVVVPDELRSQAPHGTQAEPTCEPLEAAQNPPGGFPVDDGLLAQVLAVGVKPAVARKLLRQHAPQDIAAQLAMLPDREPREPAAVLVKSIAESWNPPGAYVDRQKARQAEARAQEAQAQARAAQARAAQEHALKAQERASEAEDNARLDAEWETLPPMKRDAVERQITVRLALLGGPFGRGPGAVAAMRRTLQRELATTGTLAAQRGDLSQPSQRATST